MPTLFLPLCYAVSSPFSSLSHSLRVLGSLSQQLSTKWWQETIIQIHSVPFLDSHLTQSTDESVPFNCFLNVMSKCINTFSWSPMKLLFWKYIYGTLSKFSLIQFNVWNILSLIELYVLHLLMILKRTWALYLWNTGYIPIHLITSQSDDAGSAVVRLWLICQLDVRVVVVQKLTIQVIFRTYSNHVLYIMLLFSGWHLLKPACCILTRHSPQCVVKIHWHLSEHCV